MMKIIGFSGRKRSGKTLLSKVLQDEYGAVIITIAKYLKDLCCKVLDISYDELIKYKDSNKILNIKPNEKWFDTISKYTDIPYDVVKNELCHRTIRDIRDMLQVVGTDLIRKYNADWHINKIKETINLLDNDTLIAIDDVRFPNERKLIEDYGGQVFFIINTFNYNISNHISETSLQWRDFDAAHIILNTIENKEYFCNEFKKHYNDDFNEYTNNSIFLYENLRFLTEIAITDNPLIIEDKKFFRKTAKQ